MADPEHKFDLEELANQPGTYFNPQTEVVVIVDDSVSIDQDVFDIDNFEGTDWVRVSDEVPVDESALDELVEEFSSTHHSGVSMPTAALELDDDEETDDEDDGPEPDPDPED